MALGKYVLGEWFPANISLINPETTGRGSTSLPLSLPCSSLAVHFQLSDVRLWLDQSSWVCPVFGLV